jgi:hypothetical protein
VVGLTGMFLGRGGVSPGQMKEASGNRLGVESSAMPGALVPFYLLPFVMSTQVRYLAWWGAGAARAGFPAAPVPAAIPRI